MRQKKRKKEKSHFSMRAPDPGLAYTYVTRSRCTNLFFRQGSFPCCQQPVYVRAKCRPCLIRDSFLLHNFPRDCAGWQSINQCRYIFWALRVNNNTGSPNKADAYHSQIPKIWIFFRLVIQRLPHLDLSIDTNCRIEPSQIANS